MKMNDYWGFGDRLRKIAKAWSRTPKENIAVAEDRESRGLSGKISRGVAREQEIHKLVEKSPQELLRLREKQILEGGPHSWLDEALRRQGL